jgi:polyisoprenoid-binding protein YceI
MKRWTVDPTHSQTEFAVKHMMFTTVRGHFSQIEGEVSGAMPDLTTAEITVKVATASVDTRDAKRDEHLRSADFFDVEQHPYMTFVSHRIEQANAEEYRLIGDLTIRGVTQEVEFKGQFDGEGKDPWGNNRAGFSAEATVNRKDFGLHWNAALETGGFMVSDLVKLTIALQLIEQA